MNKEFKWNAQLMRRARSEFGCIECGVKEGIYRVHNLHKEGCSFGDEMSPEDKNKTLAVWAKRMERILYEDSYTVTLPRSCSVCKKRDATGTVWVSYHDDSVALFIVSDYISCDVCSLNTPYDWTEGRRWGFTWGLVTKKKWELMNFLEDTGVAK